MNNRKKKFLLLTVSIVVAAVGFYWVFITTNKDRKLFESLPRDYKLTLDQSSQFTLLSLFPIPMSGDGDPEFKNHEKFHGYPVLGKFQVKDQKLKEKLLVALYKGIYDGDEKEVMSCFNPHHGIRALHDGKTVDLVICFGCQQFEIFPQQKGHDRYVPISNSPEDTFNHALRSADVPLGNR